MANSDVRNATFFYFGRQKNMKQYLGDSVYVDNDGYYIILTTEQGDNVASNKIYLEPVVVKELKAYIEKFEQRGEFI